MSSDHLMEHGQQSNGHTGSADHDRCHCLLHWVRDIAAGLEGPATPPAGAVDVASIIDSGAMITACSHYHPSSFTPAATSSSSSSTSGSGDTTDPALRMTRRLRGLYTLAAKLDTFFTQYRHTAPVSDLKGSLWGSIATATVNSSTASECRLRVDSACVQRVDLSSIARQLDIAQTISMAELVLLCASLPPEGTAQSGSISHQLHHQHPSVFARHIEQWSRCNSSCMIRHWHEGVCKWGRLEVLSAGQNTGAQLPISHSADTRLQFSPSEPSAHEGPAVSASAAGTRQAATAMIYSGFLSVQKRCTLRAPANTPAAAAAAASGQRWKQRYAVLTRDCLLLCKDMAHFQTVQSQLGSRVESISPAVDAVNHSAICSPTALVRASPVTAPTCSVLSLSSSDGSLHGSQRSISANGSTASQALSSATSNSTLSDGSMPHVAFGTVYLYGASVRAGSAVMTIQSSAVGSECDIVLECLAWSKLQQPHHTRRQFVLRASSEAEAKEWITQLALSIPFACQESLPVSRGAPLQQIAITASNQPAATSTIPTFSSSLRALSATAAQSLAVPVSGLPRRHSSNGKDTSPRSAVVSGDKRGGRRSRSRQSSHITSTGGVHHHSRSASAAAPRVSLDTLCASGAGAEAEASSPSMIQQDEGNSPQQRIHRQFLWALQDHERQIKEERLLLEEAEQRAQRRVSASTASSSRPAASRRRSRSSQRHDPELNDDQQVDARAGARSSTGSSGHTRLSRSRRTSSQGHARSRRVRSLQLGAVLDEPAQPDHRWPRRPAHPFRGRPIASAAGSLGRFDRREEDHGSGRAVSEGSPPCDTEPLLAPSGC